MITTIPAQSSLPLFIHSMSTRFAPTIGSSVSAPADAGWPAGNLAIFVPLSIPFAYPISRVFWINGSAIGANIDVGIYDVVTLKRLTSIGATAQVGISAVQYANLGYVLPPGSYYIGITSSLSGGTGRIAVNSGAGQNTMRMRGLVQMATANPLPATLVPAAVGQQTWPFCGITRTVSGF